MDEMIDYLKVAFRMPPQQKTLRDFKTRLAHVAKNLTWWMKFEFFQNLKHVNHLLFIFLLFWRTEGSKVFQS